MSEKERCFVSRRNDRVSHPVLTGRGILKRNIFWKVARVDSMRLRYPGSLFNEAGSLDNNEVLLRGADFIFGGARPG